MNTVLDYIKTYPSDFAYGVKMRQLTSVSNKELHQEMLDAIDNKDWDKVTECMQNPWYTKPLEGVIICMDFVEDDDFDFEKPSIKTDLYETFLNGKLY